MNYSLIQPKGVAVLSTPMNCVSSWEEGANDYVWVQVLAPVPCCLWAQSGTIVPESTLWHIKPRPNLKPPAPGAVKTTKNKYVCVWAHALITGDVENKAKETEHQLAPESDMSAFKYFNLKSDFKNYFQINYSWAWLRFRLHFVCITLLLHLTIIWGHLLCISHHAK